MRHARKSARQRFDEHKAQVAVDPESQLITAADVLAGDAPDHEQALELVQQAESECPRYGRAEGGRLRVWEQRDSATIR